MPALLLQGASDELTPLRAGEILRQQLPRSELRVFQAGHNLMAESPEAVQSCTSWLAALHKAKL